MKRTAMMMIFILLAALLPGNFLLAQQGIPVKQVWAEQYDQWSFSSQQANTYTFSGTNCNVYPLTDGVSPAFFAFGNPATLLYYPVLIQDATPSNSEIVTPTALSTVSSACGFSASTENQHISFTVLSGTGGLQEAVATLANSASPASPIDVMLDRTWYATIGALPGTPSAGSIIAALKGSIGVVVIDTTTAPWTYYTWNGTEYYNSGGSAVPTVTYSTGAGTGPSKASITGSGSQGTVNFTTGTSPGASDLIFTLTWPTAANGGFNHKPACTVTSVGATTPTAGTVAEAYTPPADMTYTASTTALTASTAYSFAYNCL